MNSSLDEVPEQRQRLSPVQYGLWGLFLVTTAIAAAFGLGMWLESAGAWLFVYSWIAVQLAHWLSLGYYVFTSKRSGAPYSMLPTGISAAAAIFPAITLILFVCIFVIGGSSNVAQLAGESGMDLWSLWFDVWPFLLFTNPLALLATIVAVAFPPYPPHRSASMFARFTAVLLAVFACHTVVTYFPDA